MKTDWVKGETDNTYYTEAQTQSGSETNWAEHRKTGGRKNTPETF